MTTIQFAAEDIERHYADRDPVPNQDGHEVEVLVNGSRKLLMIDGKPVHKVLEINTRQPRDAIAPQVTVTMHCKLLTVRPVNKTTFNDLAGKGANL